MAKSKKKWKTICISGWAYEALKYWADKNNRPIGRELEELIRESNRTLPINF